MEIEVKPILTPRDLKEYPSWMWQINEEFTDGSRMQHLYLVDENVPKKINDWIFHSDAHGVIKACKEEQLLLFHRPKIVAATDPQLIADGIPSISKEFLKKFTDAQGKGMIMMEMDEINVKYGFPSGINISTFDKRLLISNKEVPKLSCEYIPKLDQSGNAVLSIVPEETVESFIDGIANHLGVDRKGALDKIDKFSSKLNELKSSQEPGIIWVNDEIDGNLENSIKPFPENLTSIRPTDLKNSSGIEPNYQEYYKRISDISDTILPGNTNPEAVMRILNDAAELQKAAENFAPLFGFSIENDVESTSRQESFIAGAEWQKEQSATEAIEFADWCEDKYWPTGCTGLWRQERSSEEGMLTTKQLYELWKKSR